MSEKAILQVALDFIDTSRALRCARAAYEGGARWIEVGTPLIKAEGLDAVRTMRAEFPEATIIADMKTMDAGRAEVEIAAKAGADVVAVLGVASEATILEAIEAGKHYGVRVLIDLLGVADLKAAAKKFASWGASYLNVHSPIDAQMRGSDPFEDLRSVCSVVDIPVSVAGGINTENAITALECGASIIVVGGAINKAEDVQEATKTFCEVLSSGVAVKTDLYKRGSNENLAETLKRVSVANISDAFHRGGVLSGIKPVSAGLSFAGPAVTVRTLAGDWAKPVRAIDAAEEGSVLVIDAGGVGPALWGELATYSASMKKLAGVVVYGAVRDVEDIRKLGFPVFSTLICPNAGEPKGFGEINVTLKIGAISVAPGDWVIGDDDGVVVLPASVASEYANRAMDVLEKENSLRAEIGTGKTLGEVAHLAKWEKQK